MPKNQIKNIVEVETTKPFVPPVVTLPPRIEKVYRLAKEGTIGNIRVQELTIQGDQVLERKFVSERDARPYTMSKLMSFVEERLRREYP